MILVWVGWAGGHGNDPGVSRRARGFGVSPGWRPGGRVLGGGGPTTAADARGGLPVPGQPGAGRARMAARTPGSRCSPGGSRMISCPPWRTSRAGTAIRRRRKVAIIALPPRTPWPSTSSPPRMRPVSWWSQAAIAAAISEAHIQAGVDLLVRRGQVPQRGAVLRVAEDVLDAGAVPVPVLAGRGLGWCRDVDVGADEAVGVDRRFLLEFGEGQRPLSGVQGAAAPRPGVGGDVSEITVIEMAHADT